MSNLNPKASHEYWRNYPDSSIHRVISFMESVEDPLHQGHALLEALLVEFSNVLDTIENVNLDKLNEQESFIKIANQLKMTQTLRLLQILDTNQPGSAAKLLMYAENTTKHSEDDAGIFLKRNLAFERLRLLSRIFSKERLSLVLNALEE